MTIDRKTILVLVAAVAFGWWLAGSHAPAPAPGPFGPTPQPRPVLTLLGRLARLGLWVMLAAEKPPAEQHYVVHSAFDEHGHPQLHNARGW